MKLGNNTIKMRYKIFKLRWGIQSAIHRLLVKTMSDKILHWNSVWKYAKLEMEDCPVIIIPIWTGRFLWARRTDVKASKSKLKILIEHLPLLWSKREPIDDFIDELHDHIIGGKKPDRYPITTTPNKKWNF